MGLLPAFGARNLTLLLRLPKVRPSQCHRGRSCDMHLATRQCAKCVILIYALDGGLMIHIVPFEG